MKDDPELDDDAAGEDRERERVRLSSLRYGGSGIKCPSCGCSHFYTRRTTRKKSKIVRRRECRHCGRLILTTEKLDE